MLSFTSDGNETWSREPVAISDTSQPVREDIETGFVLNVNYTVTVTVFMEHRNLTSAANFSELFILLCVHTFSIQQLNSVYCNR